MADRGKIKGVAFGEFLVWHEKRNGSSLVKGAVREVEQHYREGLDPDRAGFGVLASRWYPAEVVHELVDRLVSGRSPAELDAMARDAAGFIMGRTLKGVYRAVIAMFGSPDRYARHIDKLWGMHYDTGRVLVQESSPTSHRVRYSGWEGHHEFICRMNMASSVAIYGAMGCRDVSYERVGCISAGAPYCESIARWTR